MYKSDYHLHSHFSADSLMTMEELCQTAYNKGLAEIAITDHHDLDYQDPNITFLIDKNNYFNEIEKYQAKYQADLKIKKGLELGLQPHILEECSDFIAEDFDFVIASFHTVDKKVLYGGEFFKNYSQLEANIKYLENMLEILKKYDNYNVLGHLDLIRRYGNFKEQIDLMKNPKTKAIIRAILKLIIKKDKGLEVNTSGLRIKGENPLPSFEILNLYYQLGGRIITLASDSHRTQDIANKFSSTAAKLKKIGFQEHATFTNMEVEFHKI